MQEIIKLIASKPCHPEGGLPGGVPRSITEEERKWIIETADFSVDFARFPLQLFKQVVLDNKEYVKLVISDLQTKHLLYGISRREQEGQLL